MSVCWTSDQVFVFSWVIFVMMFNFVRLKCCTTCVNHLMGRSLKSTWLLAFSTRQFSVLRGANIGKIGFRKLQKKAIANGVFVLCKPAPLCPVITSKYFLSSYAGQQTFKQKLWRIIRVVFVITGGLVWTAPVLLYASIATGIVQVDVEERELQGTGDDLTSRILSFYNIPKSDEGSHSKEVDSKDFALHRIWEKLRQEEGITRKFGSPVHISGFRISHALDKSAIQIADNCSNTTTENESTESIAEGTNVTKTNNTWNASCYIEGPKHTGILDVGFTKVNEDWIPVSLYLETLQKSGEVICNVSALPPNGLTRFTRLSDG